ncbi:MAG: SAM-dependent methyltransferase, partial [Verrucomicrobiota bacterium]|nr:SAM-dependent methyltransferase [Verrucomicrobiota bacterium]
MDGELPLPELSPAPLTPGTLYLVATPIGNMEDITMRAIRTLRDCDLVAAEDTRHTGMLLKRLGLAKRQISTHKFNEAKRSAEIITLLEQGGTVSLVSDAGSPGISDPGQRVVDAVLVAGFRVEAV